MILLGLFLSFNKYIRDHYFNYVLIQAKYWIEDYQKKYPNINVNYKNALYFYAKMFKIEEIDRGRLELLV